MVNAFSMREKRTFFSCFNPAWCELRSTVSQYSFAFKVSQIIPSLTSNSLAKSLFFKKGKANFFKQTSFFCAAVSNLRFLEVSGYFLEVGIDFVFGILKKTYVKKKVK